jgi:hypothetical protein
MCIRLMDMRPDRIRDLKADFERDGVIFLPGFLDAEALADAQDAYDWSLANPGPYGTTFPDDPGARQDLGNPGAFEAYRPMLERSPLPALLAKLWDSGSVWFMYEQVFLKANGGQRTPWHQDTPYIPADGRQMAVCWISFDSVSRAEALEYCLGSHLGPTFNAVSFKPGDPTDPLWKDADLPRMPDIEAARGDWRIDGFAVEPGDVVIFHPSAMHGGGQPAPGRRRRTLSLRFFGDDVVYAKRPGPTPAPRVDGLHELASGAPFRNPAFPKLV